MAGSAYVVAFLSAVFNGSWTAVFKMESVARLKPDSRVFMLYASWGVFLSSLITLGFLKYNPDVTGKADAGTEAAFTPWGIVAGGLFVLALTCSFEAVDCIGVALAQGIWSGGAIFLSFFWGLALDSKVHRVGITTFGVLLLIAGSCGVTFSEQIAHRLIRYFSDASAQSETDPTDGVSLRPSSSSLTDESAGANDYRELSDESDARESSGEFSAGGTRYVRGCLFAVGVAVFGSAILVPQSFVPESKNGLAFVLSFGIGTLVVSPVVFVIALALRGETQLPPMHIRETLGPGMFSGFIWNCGNVCTIIAIPKLGYAVAYPILQCALFFAALWGIFAFDEVKGCWTVSTVFASGAVIIAGAVCLAIGVGS